MYKTRVQTGDATRLTLTQMAGDVTVTGWDEPDVLIELETGTERDVSIEQTEVEVALSALTPSKLHLHVPASLPLAVQHAMANMRINGMADLKVEQVRGNLRLSDISQAVITTVHGNLTVNAATLLRVDETVYGNATVKSVQTADLQSVRGNLQGKVLNQLRASGVSGNLHAQELDGPLSAEKIGGNAFLKGMAGPVTLAQVGGNFVGKGLTAGAKVDQIGGNLVLNGEIGAARTYQFKSKGNAVLRLAEETSAHLTLSAQGIIQSSATLSDETREHGTLSGTLGEGGAEIIVEAEGNILLGGAGPVVSDELRQEISHQVEESLHVVEDTLRSIDFEAIGQQVSAEVDRAMAQVQAKLESVDWQHIGRRTQKSLERAMKRMQHDIDRLTEKASRRQEKLERMAQRSSQRQEKLKQISWGIAGAAEPEEDLDEERLAILKMVEQDKISLEEAEMLLDALE